MLIHKEKFIMKAIKHQKTNTKITTTINDNNNNNNNNNDNNNNL